MRIALWATLGIVAPFSSAWGGACEELGVDCSHGNSGGGSTGGGNLFKNLFNLFKPDPSSTADQARQHAREANDQGVQAYNKGDWATAAAYFQQALQNSPDNPVFRQNLANAQANMANQQANERAEREAMERQRQNKAAADNMQQSIQNFAQTLNAAPVSGGLDFDGRTSGNTPGGGNSGGLDFTAAIANPSKPAFASPSGDPMVVDTRKVPSKGLDNAIASAYSDAPPGVSERVRKGFQAVMDRDWKVAKAWFQDALNRDPGNAGLKRMVVLTDYTLRDRQAATSTATGPVPVAKSSSPNKAEIDKFFRNFREGRRLTPTDKVRSYVLSLPAEEFKHLLRDLKPQDSDVEYLFDLNTPRSPQNKSSAR